MFFSIFTLAQVAIVLSTSGLCNFFSLRIKFDIDAFIVTTQRFIFDELLFLLEIYFEYFMNIFLIRTCLIIYKNISYFCFFFDVISLLWCHKINLISLRKLWPKVICLQDYFIKSYWKKALKSQQCNPKIQLARFWYIIENLKLHLKILKNRYSTLN